MCRTAVQRGETSSPVYRPFLFLPIPENFGWLTRLVSISRTVSFLAMNADPGNIGTPWEMYIVVKVFLPLVRYEAFVLPHVYNMHATFTMRDKTDSFAAGDG
jgi:hypothetical protein